MEAPLVSILMSTYNETPKELDESINSILHQTYSNFEFLIINDNPNNCELEETLKTYVDSRIRIIRNEKNLGLVKSLNAGLKLCEGQYVARMDADDISRQSRIQDELLYLKKNHLDMIGSYIETIDEHGETIKSLMRFPEKHNQIAKFMRWGSCSCHPTWFLKREVCLKLHGYRKTPHCEDYDFMLRAINNGYKIGNIPKVELSYRIRKSGVSKSHEAEQFLLRDYLAQNMKRIDLLTEESITEFLDSEKFHRQVEQLTRYKNEKQIIKNGSSIKKIKAATQIPKNCFFWRDIVEKTTLLLREHT
ncbi:MAG: glycosyltransferase [Clostridium sp. 44_14]|jgi:glycosyltransferase involved in cell wall biosynthesis|uniref:glycosyltransferase n=1 Tax=Jutongia sp. TaxID=2944204 RepID=UPI00033A7A1C|nr:MAG: glycosyltransferase [Clostridium sp. 44_14]CDE69487.1 predicted glycosyltransferases [Clostridium sp. CAG:277]